MADFKKNVSLCNICIACSCGNKLSIRVSFERQTKFKSSTRAALNFLPRTSIFKNITDSFNTSRYLLESNPRRYQG